jgi:hypothetical protein
MMARFCRYVDKAFAFGEAVRSLSDRRIKPRIPTAFIWAGIFFLFVTRQGSLNAMESALRLPRMQRIVGRRPSADRIGDVASLMDPEELREFLSRINHRLKRNKALKGSWSLTVAAIDGHEFFSQQAPVVSCL